MWTIEPKLEPEETFAFSRLIIKPKVLAFGQDYKITVTVRDGRGFATYDISTTEKIAESCSVDPLEGVEVETDFRITCWKGFFVYTLYQDDTQLVSSNNEVFVSKLNANGVVRVKIENSVGQYLLSDLEVKVEELNAFNSLEEINEIFTSEHDSHNLKRIVAEEAQGNAIVFINAISDRLHRFESVDVTETVVRILDLMNGLRINDFDDVAPVAQTMLKLVSIQLNHKVTRKCGYILGKISLAVLNFVEDITSTEFVNTTKSVLAVVNELIDPFESIPPVQNSHSLISPEYHTEDYKSYGDLDYEIFEKLEDLEFVTMAIGRVINGLATCSAQSFNPMELLDDTNVDSIQFGFMAFDKEAADSRDNQLKLNGPTVEVVVSDALLSYFNSSVSMTCTFFEENPMWWYSDGNEIDSDVVAVSIFDTGNGESEHVRTTPFAVCCRECNTGRY